MSDFRDDERRRIREQKKRKLRERLETGTTAPDAAAGSTTTPTEPIHIDSPDQLQRVIDSHEVVLVDFFAEWCGPCKMLEPTVEALAAETEVAIAKVDIDRQQHLAQQLGVRSVPTLVLYAHGEPVERQAGVQQKATLKALIQQYN